MLCGTVLCWQSEHARALCGRCRIYVVFIISQIMSPILPVALSVGQMHAMNRLRVRVHAPVKHSRMPGSMYIILELLCSAAQKNNIFCLNPKRIAICGKIRIQLFDKTGM